MRQNVLVDEKGYVRNDHVLEQKESSISDLETAEILRRRLIAYGQANAKQYSRTAENRLIARHEYCQSVAWRIGEVSQYGKRYLFLDCAFEDSVRSYSGNYSSHRKALSSTAVFGVSKTKSNKKLSNSHTSPRYKVGESVLSMGFIIMIIAGLWITTGAITSGPSHHSWNQKNHGLVYKVNLKKHNDIKRININSK
ncbi:MAG: hypothetical protein M1374_06360 [Firmicutes bacterium]|nr:hypothetical protein [Bacillota bacterium]